MLEPLRDFDGNELPAEIERQLKEFRRTLLRQRIHKSICYFGGHAFEIQVDRLGYTIVTINGRRNPHLEPEAA